MSTEPTIEPRPQAEPSRPCCESTVLETCCAPSEKGACCGTATGDPRPPERCGCR